MPDLTQYLSLSDLQPFFDNARPGEDMTEAWRKQYFLDLERIVVPALMAFFKALKAEGRMVTIPSSEGYANRFWNHWNDVARLPLAEAESADGKKKLDALADHFAHYLTFRIVWPYRATMKDEGAVAAAALDKNLLFSAIVTPFNKGNYMPYEFSHENCWNTDLPLVLGFKEWQPQGGYIDVKEGGIRPISPLAPAQMQETVLELKTGNLLFADWFRISQFTMTVREKDFPLNSRKGREDQTRYLAEQFGVVSVSVGNTCPDVYQDGNQVLVGVTYEEDGVPPARLTKVGSVCTDLWAATFVEYETLIEVVARSQPDIARQLVDAYLEENKDAGTYGLQRLTVEPGTYYLYHFGYHEEFSEMARKSGIDLDAGVITPYFVLSRARLLSN